MIDLDAYARRIGFTGTFAPTLDTLVRLIERHAATIPFENIDVLAGRVPRLDVASLHDKLVQRRRGGYCFEQNAFFLAVLRQVGCAAAGLEARVRAGVPDDVVTARTHMALRVTLDGDDYLADVGFGGLAPTAPLKLGDRGVQRGAGGAYRLVESERDLLLQCETHEGWTDCYRIAASAPQPIDHEMANWWVATHPTALLRHNLLVARCAPGLRLTLFNDRLSLRRAGIAPPEERTLTTRAELADVLADAFGLRIDADDLDVVRNLIEHRATA